MTKISSGTGEHFAPEPQISRQISGLMQLAEKEGQANRAIAEMLILQLNSPPALAEEAAFRRAQLMLRYNYPDGVNTAVEVVARYPDHALVPYAHIWMAEWGNRHNKQDMVQQYTLNALKHHRLTQGAADLAITLGLEAARQASEWQKVQWLFAAAGFSPEHADAWLREAAEHASVSSIERMQKAGLLGSKPGKLFLQHAARYRLLTGNMDEIEVILQVLAMEAPNSAEYSRVRSWFEGELQKASIGVILPLSGTYSRYGKEALRGIRLAASSARGSQKLSLFIEDSGGKPQQCQNAYKSLQERGVALVIGPLMGDCVEDLIPVLSPSTPVIALTSRVELAKNSPWLFSHSLSQSIQASFMAEFAFLQGARNLVLIQSAKESGQREAATFAEMFESLGGTIAHTMQLPNEGIDYRDSLTRIRLATDDEAMLAMLDEENALFGDPEQEIRLPVSFDSMYLALSGKTVSLLAGQLVYLDISHVHLYGSSRWMDGRLLSDRGRYMSEARFSNITFPEGRAPELRRLLRNYREIWGEASPSKLSGLAYDSTLIAAMLTSRLGLQGNGVLRGLKDEAGFPGLTGHVFFDNEGIGHKIPGVFTIKRGKVVPAG
ncbi:MAG: penicillin-binding protein activator [Mariprofundaceae bacterium]